MIFLRTIFVKFQIARSMPFFARPSLCTCVVMFAFFNMADVGDSSSRIDVESFEFVPLHEYMSDNRKGSRKKHILNYRQE